MNEGMLADRFSGDAEEDYLRTLDYKLLVMELEELAEAICQNEMKAWELGRRVHGCMVEAKVSWSLWDSWP